MKTQETTEYRLVKQLTAKENRARVKLTLIGSLIGASCLYGAMWGFIHFILWLSKL